MDLVSITQPVRSRKWIGYSLAILLSIAALWVRFSLESSLAGFPFLTFFGAVVLAGFIGGLGPGLAAMALSGILANYYTIEPWGEFSLAWPSAAIAMGFYAAITGVVVWLLHLVLKAYETDALHKMELQRLNSDLERLVENRTAELQAEIVERNEAESQVRHLQKMESLGQLTGGIAHDFNNMLAVMIGALDIAKRRLTGAEDPKLGECIDNALNGAGRAATLTARLLAYSRQQPLAPKAFDASEFVENMSELIRRAIGELIEVNTMTDDGLWFVFADIAQLENAILNLAVNARDAMPDGGKLTIEASNTELDERYANIHPEVEPGQYVMIGVSDNGSGMASDVVERVFDPFFTTKEVGKGTGLGLSQVYGFVKQSGGHVNVYSEVDAGTTVKIFLPRDADDQARSAESAREDGRLTLGSADVTILVVEDDENVRAMSVQALTELGYSVIEAAGPHDALQMIADNPNIDLLFTDIVMPEMNGRELAEQVRATNPEIHILFTTGYAQNAIRHNDMVDIGANILPKPFALDQLAVKLHETMMGSASDRAR